ISHPVAQEIAAVDKIDGKALVLVFVREVAPEIIIRSERAQGLERKGDQAPRPEVIVIIGPILDMDLDSRTEFARVLMKGRLKPTFPQPAAVHPLRRQGFHL